MNIGFQKKNGSFYFIAQEDPLGLEQIYLHISWFSW